MDLENAISILEELELETQRTLLPHQSKVLKSATMGSGKGTLQRVKPEKKPRRLPLWFYPKKTQVFWEKSVSKRHKSNDEKHLNQ